MPAARNTKAAIRAYAAANDCTYTAAKRLLDRQFDANAAFGPIGMSPSSAFALARLLRRPSGLVLFAGPTGSGRSTTQTHVVKELSNEGRSTIRLTASPTSFAAAPTSLLMGRSDTIVIDELHDRDLAVGALDAGANGRRILAVWHAADAVTTVMSLRELSGVSDDQLAACPVSVVAQRLVRGVHLACAGEGCAECDGSGTDRLLAIHEVLQVTDSLLSVLSDGGSHAEATRAATASGMRTFRQDAQRLINTGETTAELVEGDLSRIPATPGE